MNAPVKSAESTALQTVDQQQDAPVRTTSAALILNGDAMERIFKFAEVMASGHVTVPKHLQGNPADCLAVTMQATQWGMNPFAVAQKTHVSQSGALGYEAQLVSAVVSSNAPVTSPAPEYEYLGDWDRILGKVEERKSDKGGKYYVATYTRAEEAGLGVICRWTLRGESKPREMKVMMSQCFPRFSTQWATDPKQQISYVAVRKWARMHAPGVLLGVYTPEELDEIPPRDMGPADLVPTIPPELLKEAEEAATKGVAAYQKFWTDTGKDNRKTLDSEHTRLKGVATDADKKRTVENQADAAAQTQAQAARAATPDTATAAVVPKADATADAVTDAEPKVTYAQVMDGLVKAKTPDAIDTAADLIKSVADEGQRAELTAKYQQLSKGMEL